MRKTFISCVRNELSRDPDLRVFLGDISVAGFLDPQDQLLDGVFNCGILEQAMVSFAAGCSAGGLYPVVQTIIPFLVERAFEQIKLDFVAQKNPGLIVGVGGGLEYSKLGYTHHTLWDTSILANLEGLLIFTPTCGPSEVGEILPTLIRERRLAYARLTEAYEAVPGTGGFGIGELRPLVTEGRTDAVVLCGAFPGMAELADDPAHDVFAYSYPNLLPFNLELLAPYRRIVVFEMGTSDLLASLLRRTLPDREVIAKVQVPRFFRTYGNASAAAFIRSNWRQH